MIVKQTQTEQLLKTVLSFIFHIVYYYYYKYHNSRNSIIETLVNNHNDN